MTVGELKEALECLDDDVQINVALQPTYPMKGSLLNVCIEHKNDDEEQVCWLAVSDNQDYGVPRVVWEESDIYEDEED